MNAAQICAVSHLGMSINSASTTCLPFSRSAEVTGKLAEPRLLYGLAPEFPCVALVGLGDRYQQGPDDSEDLHVGRENVRTAIASEWRGSVKRHDSDGI